MTECFIDALLSLILQDDDDDDDDVRRCMQNESWLLPEGLCSLLSVHSNSQNDDDGNDEEEDEKI